MFWLVHNKHTLAFNEGKKSKYTDDSFHWKRACLSCGPVKGSA